LFLRKFRCWNKREYGKRCTQKSCIEAVCIANCRNRTQNSALITKAQVS